MAKSNSRATAEKIKTAVVLTPMAIKRLGAACVAESMTQSELVEWMIHDRLKGYSVTTPSPADRAGKRRASASVMPDESADGEARVNSPAHLAL